MAKDRPQGSWRVLLVATGVMIMLLAAACGGDEEPADEPAPDGADEADDADDTDDAGDAEPADAIELDFGHYQTRGAATEGEGRFADEITERSGGEITVNVHWSEALGTSTELWDLTRQGAMEMGLVVTHFDPDPFPFHRLQAMAFWGEDPLEDLERQHEMMTEVFTMEPFERELEEANQRALLHQPLASYFLLSDEPECGLEALAGQRVRGLGNDYPRMLESVDATPVSLTTPELYEALDRGTIDALSVAMSHMDALDLHEVGSYACGPIFIFGNGHTTTINLDVWESLSAEQQGLIDEVAAETQDWYHEHALETEQELRETLEERGVEFVPFPEEDLQEWQERSPDVIAEWVESLEAEGLGEEAAEVADRVREVWGQ